MDLTLDSLLLFVPAFVIAIAMHEASHAFAATILGDPTPRVQGRLSLNPLRHLDPLGTITLFLVGFGWGKPVVVNPRYFKVNPLAGMALTAVAGPLMNVLLALLFALPFRMQWHMVGWPLAFAEAVASINLLLAVFNLIPLPPLDGFSVLMGILPRPLAIKIAPLAQYGPGALLAIFALGYVFKLNILGAIMAPPYHLLQPLIFGG
ncbi:MAG TPA: site-2 protease family protein [Chloroflexota bacterium]|nr:site-2 protease family protein [Chloroflexota bacterium]